MILKQILNRLKNIYPIGSVYISVNNTNPSTLFGGSWVQFGQGRTLVGVDTNDPNFDIPLQHGGSKTHRHNFKIGLGWYYGSPIGENAEDSNAGAYKYSNNTYGKWTKSGGENTTARLNNGIEKEASSVSASVSISDGDTDTASSLQPYVTVYMWRRTA